MRRTPFFPPLSLLSLMLLFLSNPALAWGPHTEITRAAIAVQPNLPELKKSFGDELDRIAKDYCWMGDWRESVRPDHYADDYLLFPNAPDHSSHMPPEVRRTYKPFFLRALQALRTENPQNSSRWIGSLLHFLQDLGSPPHAANVGGATHTKMERWLDESKIHIADYKPRLLGKTDEEALAGLLERMDQLHAFAKVRGEKLKPLVEKLTIRENQSLELECALETAHVTADVLFTLFTLCREAPAKIGGSFSGNFVYPAHPTYAAVPAKVVLQGTNYSTTTDPEGSFSFRNLPPGKYIATILTTGHRDEFANEFELAPGRETRLDRKLEPDRVSGNLVRNPTFTVRWVRDTQPDCWYRDSVRRNRWASALIRVPLDQRCVVNVDFKPEHLAPIALRWRTDPSKAEGREVKLNRLPAEVAPDPLTKPFEKGFLFLEVLIETKLPLPEVCKHVSVVFAR